MRILHLWQGGFPNERIERFVRTEKKEGFESYFAGRIKEGAPFSNTSIEKTFPLPFNRYSNARIPFYWNELKNKLSKILEDIRPDIINAHDIVAGRLAIEFSIPFVYDDREYWSKRCEAVTKNWEPNKLFIKWLWTSWEKEILKNASATVTVSKTIADEHKGICEHTYVVQNLPCRIETENLKLIYDGSGPLSSIYIGSDFSETPNRPHRNVTSCLKLFNEDNIGTLTVIGDEKLNSSKNVESLGFLPHKAMMEELTKHHIGLIPWKSHWYHVYCNPNKPYEYTHAGLLVIASSGLVNIKQNLNEHCILFEDQKELKEILQHYANNLDEIIKIRPIIREFAVENLSWEKVCEPNVLEAYSKI